jgi:SAM-dependent methyltransferase
MREIKKLLIKRTFKTKFFNFLRYFKRLFINKGIITFFSKKSEKSFYDIWKEEIVFDLKQKQNWRKDREHFLKMIDFLTFQKIFTLLSKTNNTILEIGSYDGFFVEHYQDFNKIILSDITEYSDLYPNNPKFDFVLLNGKDLSNIKKNSVDVVFSIDVFVRLDKMIIKTYIKDLIQIVKPGGYMILHVPNIFHLNSMFNKYTKVSKSFYRELLLNYCDEIIFDDELYELSSFLICKRNGKN